MHNNVFAFANQKGGVGKTTSCVNLAAVLHSKQRKVLLIDLDPQGNATMGSGVAKNEVTYSINDVLLGNCSAQEAVIKETKAGYAVLPANSDLTEAEVALIGKAAAEKTLDEIIKQFANDYDYIFLDCPPSLNMLTVNALSCAKHVVIVMQCEYYALEGLSDLLSTIAQISASVNQDLAVFGILRTLMESRSRLSTEVSKQVTKYFGKQVFKTAIPRNIRLAEAPSYGLPITMYDKNSAGSKAYISLGAEFIKRFEEELMGVPKIKAVKKVKTSKAGKSSKANKIKKTIKKAIVKKAAKKTPNNPTSNKKDLGKKVIKKTIAKEALNKPVLKTIKKPTTKPAPNKAVKKRATKRELVEI